MRKALVMPTAAQLYVVILFAIRNIVKEGTVVAVQK